MKRLGMAIIPLLAASSANAHIVGARLGDFYSGALHPLTDLLDVLLWIALGLLAASLGAARGRWLVLVLPLGLIAGLALGLDLHVDVGGQLTGAVMMVVLGVVLAAGIRISAMVLALVGLAVAVVRGMANAGGVAPETDPTLFAAGLAASGYVAITLVTAAVVAFREYGGAEQSPRWRSIALRACGSWMAAIGLMLGGFVLAS